jgi:hypothetical protein
MFAWGEPPEQKRPGECSRPTWMSIRRSVYAAVDSTLTITTRRRRYSGFFSISSPSSAI